VFHQLLIATDGSDASCRAVAQGLELARALGATALVVRVSGAPAHIVVLGVDLTELPESVKVEIAKRIEAHFAWVRKTAADLGVSCETLRVESERPWQGILETAESRGVDMIVMASHGRRGRAARLIGSETMRVLTNGTLPVLVLT
jgi:nucleotide-binding universal stress UspA family protein